MAPCEKAVARTHVLARIVEDAPIGQFGQRGLAGSHHRERFTGLPHLATVIAEKRGTVVVGTPRHIVRVFGSHDTGRREQAPLARAECKRDAGLHGTDPFQPRFQAKAIGPEFARFARPCGPVVTTAEQPALAGIDIEQIAIGLVYQRVAVLRVRRKQDLRIPRATAIPTTPTGAAAGRLKDDQRTVASGHNAAPASASLPKRLGRFAEWFTQEML